MNQCIQMLTPGGWLSILLNLEIRGVAQFGRALGLGPRGRRFKSGRPDFYATVV